MHRMGKGVENYYDNHQRKIRWIVERNDSQKPGDTLFSYDGERAIVWESVVVSRCLTISR
jgi:hypothetical protein